ncbi:MAG: hypothetical protein U1E65_23205 [Myxococcota bacterium]
MITLVITSILAAAPSPCAEARALYESLSIEAAVESASKELSRNPDRPLACLEVRGLGLLVQGRMEEARPAFAELFSREPDYPVKDASLSPSMLDLITRVREESRPLTAVARARWMLRSSLRLDVLLEGGLRHADRVRWAVETGPEQLRDAGTMPLVGRAATATVAIPASADIVRARVLGDVLDPSGRALAHFDDQLLLPPRPEEVESSSGVPLWPIFAGAGALAVGATVVIIMLAQPHLPDTKGTLGRVPL